jgi:hypothetical protein
VRRASAAFALALLCAVAGPGRAAEPVDVTPGQVRATTVYVDAQAGMRTNGSAKRLNAKHAEMEAQGWRFASLEAYNENGDLVGFFVTYVR